MLERGVFRPSLRNGVKRLEFRRRRNFAAGTLFDGEMESCKIRGICSHQLALSLLIATFLFLSPSAGLSQSLEGDTKSLEAATIQDLINDYKTPEEGDTRYFQQFGFGILEVLARREDPAGFRFIAETLSEDEQFLGQHGEISSVAMRTRLLTEKPILGLSAVLGIYPGLSHTHRLRLVKVIEAIRASNLDSTPEMTPDYWPMLQTQPSPAASRVGMPNWFLSFEARIVAVLSDALNRSPEESYQAALVARNLGQPETLRLLIPLLEKKGHVIARRPIQRWDYVPRPVQYKFNWVPPILIYLRPDLLQILNALDVVVGTPVRKTSYAVLAAELLGDAKAEGALLPSLNALERADPEAKIGILRALRRYDVTQLQAVAASIEANDFLHLRGLLLEIQAELGLPVSESAARDLFQTGDIDVQVYVLQSLGDNMLPRDPTLIVTGLRSENPLLRQAAATASSGYLDLDDVRRLLLRCLNDLDRWVRRACRHVIDGQPSAFTAEEIQEALERLEPTFLELGELTNESFPEMAEPDPDEWLPFRGLSYSIAPGFEPELPPAAWLNNARALAHRNLPQSPQWQALVSDPGTKLPSRATTAILLGLSRHPDSGVWMADALRGLSEADASTLLFGLRLRFLEEPAPSDVTAAVLSVASDSAKEPLLRLFSIETLGVITRGSGRDLDVSDLVDATGSRAARPRRVDYETWSSLADSPPFELLLKEFGVMPNTSATAAVAAALYARYDRAALGKLIELASSVEGDDQRLVQGYLLAYARPPTPKQLARRLAPEYIYGPSSLDDIFQKLSQSKTPWVRRVANSHLK